MPPNKPIKRYTGAADGRTIGLVLNELIDEVNNLVSVVEKVSILLLLETSPDMSLEELKRLERIMEKAAKREQKQTPGSTV